MQGKKIYIYKNFARSIYDTSSMIFFSIDILFIWLFKLFPWPCCEITIVSLKIEAFKFSPFLYSFVYIYMDCYIYRQDSLPIKIVRTIDSVPFLTKYKSIICIWKHFFLLQNKKIIFSIYHSYWFSLVRDIRL